MKLKEYDVDDHELVLQLTKEEMSHLFGLVCRGASQERLTVDKIKVVCDLYDVIEEMLLWK